MFIFSVKAVHTHNPKDSMCMEIKLKCMLD